MQDLSGLFMPDFSFLIPYNGMTKHMGMNSFDDH